MKRLVMIDFMSSVVKDCWSNFTDFRTLLVRSIKCFSKQPHDINSSFSSMYAYLSPIILLSNKVDYYWWWCSSSSWPSCAPTYILISYKVSDISGGAMLWHCPMRYVFVQFALITGVIIGQGLILWHKELPWSGSIISHLSWTAWTSSMRHSVQRQKHHCHLVLSWHCHFIVMAVMSALLMSCSTVYVTDVAVIRAAACEGLSPQLWPASRLQRSLCKRWVMAVAGTEWDMVPLR